MASTQLSYGTHSIPILKSAKIYFAPRSQTSLASKTCRGGGLADAHDLGSCTARCGGSTPLLGTTQMKRVIIVHGWDGHPEEGWFPWLKDKLEKKEFQVQVPTMPKPGEPKINLWVSRLAKVVGNVDKNTFFVGH